MQQVSRSSVAASVCAIVILAAAGPAAGAESPQAAIEAGNAKFGGLFPKGDGAGVAALYTPDAQVFPPGGDAVSGRPAIQKFWQGVMDSGVKGAKLTTVEVMAHGDMAHEVGRYELSGADGKRLDHGKYVVIWKRDGGQWRLHRDIWNTSAAPAK